MSFSHHRVVQHIREKLKPELLMLMMRKLKLREVTGSTDRVRTGAWFPTSFLGLLPSLL